MFKYKGYTAVVNYEPEDKILIGDIINTRDTITFTANNIELVEAEFHKAVDQYLTFCKKLGKKPNKPFSGNIPLRLAPDLHEAVSAAAATHHVSLNSFIKEAIEQKLQA